MSKHTPGPWKVMKDGHIRATFSDEYGTWDAAIACTYDDFPDGDINKPANVALIAAAPDLLEALETTIIPLMRLGDFIGNTDKGGASGLGEFDRCAIILKVKAAIAKAKGEQS